MISNVLKHKSLSFLLLILFLQCALYATVLFDIPIARQVICFIYLNFVPGFILVRLLKLDKLGLITSLILSVGFSVAFLMFSGLLIDESFLLFNLSQPLSLTPLLAVISSFTLVGAFVVYFRSERCSAPQFEISGIPILSVILFSTLPILSIVGAYFVNIYYNNLLLLFTIISIALLFSMGILSKKFLPSRFYTLAVFMMALAILYHSSLITNYIVFSGSDVSLEYYVFYNTLSAKQWVSANLLPGALGLGRTHAMLSVTVLPTIYSTLLNLDPTWVFKLLTPFIFSFVPLILYCAWKDIFGPKKALISAFLFMALTTFYLEMLGLNRQMIAELFFALLLYITLTKKISSSTKIVCFLVFGSALIVSHYAIAEIFLFFAFMPFLYYTIRKRPNRSIKIEMLILFSVIMFAWYVFTSNASTFDAFLSYGQYVINQINDFFNISSRESTVLLGLGLQSTPSIWNTISRVFAYITEALLVIGFLGLARKQFKNRQFNEEYFIFAVTSMMFLFALILIPGLSSTFNISRFYHTLLFFMAPLCVIGMETIVNFISKRKRQFLVSALLLLVLVPYFLFQTGFVYEVTKTDSYSISLSKYRMSPIRLYVELGSTDIYSVYGAQWLSKNIHLNSTIYSDVSSVNTVLQMYGHIYSTDALTNITKIDKGGLVYLSSLNVAYGQIVGLGPIWNSTDLSPIFDRLNLIYNNGKSVVFLNASDFS